MDVIVIGGGIAGMATAWQLREAGHRVRVVERHANLAQGATYGHGGTVLPSPLDVWFGPTFMRRERSVRGGVIDKAGLRGAARAFTRRLAKLQKPDAFGAQYALLRPLINLAQHELDALVRHRELASAVDEPRRGMLHLVRSAAGLTLLQPAIELLQRFEIPHQIVTDTAECTALERTLPGDSPFAGGVWLPDGRAINCLLFIKRLRQMLEATDDVRFLTGHTVSTLRLDAQRATIELAPGRTGFTKTHADVMSADAVVVAAGAGTPSLVERQGITLPFYPVRLFTLNAPTAHEECMPTATLVDSPRRITLVRATQRLRISGSAVMLRAGQADKPLPATLAEEAQALLGETSRDCVPGAAKISSALPWEGLKLLSSDGLPAVGRTAHPRLFISAGHGPAGWAQAFGSGRLIAELMAGAAPSLPAETVEALRPERFAY